jgi:hypothetical protein
MQTTCPVFEGKIKFEGFEDRELEFLQLK